MASVIGEPLVDGGKSAMVALFVRECMMEVSVTNIFLYKSELTLDSYLPDIFGHYCGLNIHPLRPGQDCTTLWDYLRDLSPAQQVLSFEQRQLQLHCHFG